MLLRDGVILASDWAEYRPEQLKPSQFIDLTIDIYGEKGSETSNRALSSKIPSVAKPAPAEEEKEKEKEDNGKLNLERQEEIELATQSAPSSSSKSITSRRVSVLRDMLLKKRRDIKNKDCVSASAEHAQTGEVGVDTAILNSVVSDSQVEKSDAVWRKPFSYSS